MNKFFQRKLALFSFGFFVLFLTAATYAQTKNEVLIIADRRADCAVISKRMCLQVKKPQDEKWTLFQQKIESFDYTEGYTYIVRVEIGSVKNPSADKSNLRYRLKKILYRERTASEDPSGDSNLSDNEWKLTRVDGAEVNAPKASINFNLDKSTVGGNGGCNGFGGDLKTSGNEMKISQIISTKMFCDATSEIENKFLSNLERVTKYRISGGKLFLYADDKIVLEFASKN